MVDFDISRDTDERLIKQDNALLAKSTFSATLQTIPMIGSFLAMAYNYKSDLEERRLLHFVEMLAEYFRETTGKSFNRDFIESEDFIIFFHSVIEHAKLTHSDEKLQRFSSILINQIENPYVKPDNGSYTFYRSDFAETFLDIVQRINEEQITILNEFRRYESTEIIVSYTKEERGIVNGGAAIRTEEPGFLDHHYYGLDERIYLFYIQDLISKGLIYDDGQGRVGVGPFKLLRITPFGKEFLLFIEGKAE